jgi:hypothetical protein
VVRTIHSQHRYLQFSPRIPLVSARLADLPATDARVLARPLSRRHKELSARPRSGASPRHVAQVSRLRSGLAPACQQEHHKHHGASDRQSGKVEHETRNEEVEHVSGPFRSEEHVTGSSGPRHHSWATLGAPVGEPQVFRRHAAWKGTTLVLSFAMRRNRASACALASARSGLRFAARRLT